MRLIQKFEHGLIYFDVGNFDDWCIFLTTKNTRLYDRFCVPVKGGHGPKDHKILTALAELGEQYGRARVYSDFVKFYDMTTEEITPEALQVIHDISLTYVNRETVEILFCMLYACMVAEYHKSRAKLYKRIKRLAVHQVLIDEPRKTPAEANVYSRGRAANYHKWRGSLSLNDECTLRGF